MRYSPNSSLLFPLENSAIRGSLLPVSYTHLDVYKRQKVFSVTYLYMLTSLFSFPCLTILPALCSRSAGRQGTSRSCKAISLFCTFVPAPIFCVEPIKIRISPFLTFAKSSSFCLSEFASCIKAVSYTHLKRYPKRAITAIGMIDFKL